jgi:hypothetical protein
MMASAIVTTSVAPERRSPIGASGRERPILGWLEDAGLSLLLVFACPLAVLAVGAPMVLAVRLVIEIGRRW